MEAQLLLQQKLDSEELRLQIPNPNPNPHPHPNPNPIPSPNPNQELRLQIGQMASKLQAAEASVRATLQPLSATLQPSRA